MHPQSCKKTFVHSESVFRHHPWKYDKTLYNPRSALQAALFTHQCYACIVCSCSHVHESRRGADTGNGSVVQFRTKDLKRILHLGEKLASNQVVDLKLKILDLSLLGKPCTHSCLLQH